MSCRECARPVLFNIFMMVVKTSWNIIMQELCSNGNSIEDVRKPSKISQTKCLFLAALPRCSKSRATYDNTDLSSTDSNR